MMSHGAILCNCMGAYKLLVQLGLGHDVFLSFLPLSHAYEHTAGQFFPITIGAEIYYAEGVDHLLRNLRSEEHTSELQSLMRISYAVFCLKKKKTYKKITTECRQHHKL